MAGLTIIRPLLLLTCTFQLSLTLLAQENDSTKSNKLEIRGYVKNLQTLTFNKRFSDLVTNNLIHNRINVRWRPTSKLTAAVEFRNRLFWGEEVHMTPDFHARIRNANEAVNLTILWLNKESMVLQTNIDRLWLEYRAGRWETRVGRQRINWGIGTIWNPNDIFNTYNFLDFDYEERPGRDAIKLSYRLSDLSKLEFAGAAADRNSKAVAALKYFINKWNYDFQFSGGVFHQKMTIGAGWSGSIRNAGFKGEIEYFAPQLDTANQVNISLEADYVLKHGWYVNVGGLYNSSGISEPVNDWNFVAFRLSPQNLMPTKWNSVVTLSNEITPLLSGHVSVIYAPLTNLIILLPSIKYNIASNVDVDLIWQSFLAEQFNRFEGVSHRCFIRLKWNF